MMSRLGNPTLLLTLALCASLPAVAQPGPGPHGGHHNYHSTPELYTPGPYPGAPPIQENSSFVEAWGAFGQARSTGGETPGTAYFGGADWVKRFGRSSWSAVQVGVGLMTGSAEYGANKVTTSAGLIAHAGRQHSIGQGLFWIWRLGVGPVFGTFSGAEPSISASATGLAIQGEGLFGFKMDDSGEIVSGLQWSHLSFAIRGDDTSFPVNLNIPALKVGIRWRL